MHTAEKIAIHDPVATFVADAYRALTDLGLRNKMISLPEATKGRSIDLAVNPDALVELLAKPEATFKIGDDLLPLTSESNRPDAKLRRDIIALIADADVIASEQGIETRRLAIGSIEWKDAENTIRTAPLFTMPVQVTNDLMIASAGPIEPNETFPLFAASFGCTVAIDSNKPPSQALSVKAHAVEPVKAGGIAILGYRPRVNLNLYTGKSIAMHRALDLATRPHLVTAGSLKILAGMPPDGIGANPETPNLHIVHADTSQDEAVTAARAGESFVLQGPPGTGKSQTIVNIVANLLNDGKRVLVSAEKTAALDVIASRWPKDTKGTPTPVLLTENGPALPSDTRFAVATPAVAALKIPPGVGFDVLIVDEASQIRLSHAAVVAALATQIIVIGDSQQMTPTSQFTKASQSGESSGMLTSLLDHAVEIRLPSRMLKQHYRSKHESLILFSNRSYYDGQLDIVPSPLRDNSLGVSFRYVPDAIYDRGGNGDNTVEAKAIIADAIDLARINHDRRKNPLALASRSVGIITLNESQRNLILSLLFDALEKEGLGEIDLADDSGRERPFVKTLENVQGDERDVILISSTYGADQKGRFIANLGVLSQPGAHKRVNVLATRSKWKTVVYHSFEIHQLAKNDSRSAEAFRDYWKRASKMSVIQPVTTPSADDGTDELDAALRVIQRRFSGERYSLHRFPRFLAGFDHNDPLRYTACFYFEGLFPQLQEASDLARLENAGWNLYCIAIEKWRNDPDYVINGIYRALVGAAGPSIRL